MRHNTTYSGLFDLGPKRYEAENIKSPYPYLYGGGEGAFVVHIVTNYKYTDAMGNLFFNNTLEEPYDTFDEDMEPVEGDNYSDAFSVKRSADYGFKEQIIIGTKEISILRIEERNDGFYAVVNDGNHQISAPLTPNQPLNKICVTWDDKRIYLCCNGNQITNTVHNGNLGSFGIIPVDGIAVKQNFTTPVQVFRFSPTLFNKRQMEDVTRVLISTIEFEDVFNVDLTGRSLVVDDLKVRKSFDAFGSPVNGETYTFGVDAFTARDAFGAKFQLAGI